MRLPAMLLLAVAVLHLMIKGESIAQRVHIDEIRTAPFLPSERDVHAELLGLRHGLDLRIVRR